jgi:hypothetical protein
MAFWIGILVGGAFAWFAVKLGFYQTWVLVFNIIISVYLAIYLYPVTANISATGDTPYSNILTIAAVAAVSFLLLQGIAYVFLVGQFSVSFPKVFDTLGSGILGFLAGFLFWSFLVLLIYITPVSQNTFIEGIGFKDEYRKTTVSYISLFCNMVNAVASSEDNKYSAEQTINELLSNAKSALSVKTAEKSELLKPAQKPSEAKTGVTDPNKLGPPPEIDEGI